MPTYRELTLEEFLAEGQALFGEDRMTWRFVCPACGHVASIADYKAAGAPESSVGFSCVGRWLDHHRGAFDTKKSGPCDYAGGGLIRLNPIKIKGENVSLFDFDRSGQNNVEEQP